MNSNKFLIVVVIFIIGFMLLGEFGGFVNLKVGETSEVQGKNVEVVNIGPDFVRLKIGDEKILVKINAERELKGVQIKVNDIFYVDEIEGRFADVELSSSYVCGNDVCDETEDKISCCNDCSCDSGFNCIDNRCKSPSDIDECWQSSDCKDDNPETVDLCSGTPKRCYNKIIIECSNDLDCDDGNSETVDSCKNNECFNEKGSEIKTEQPLVENETIEEKSINLKKKKGFFFRIFSKLFGWI